MLTKANDAVLFLFLQKIRRNKRKSLKKRQKGYEKKRIAEILVFRGDSSWGKKEKPRFNITLSAGEGNHSSNHI